MLMYVERKENGQLYLNSILNGPYQFKEINDPRNPDAGRSTHKRLQIMADLNADERNKLNVTPATSTSPSPELAIPMFNPTDDPIGSIYKAMMFLCKAFTIRYLPTNNQLKTSSNPRTQANVQEDSWSYTWANAIKFKEKMLLVRKEEAEDTLDDEEQDFMTDHLEAFDSDYEEELTTSLLFMADCVDAFDLDYDEDLTASVIFMTNISPVGSVTDEDLIACVVFMANIQVQYSWQRFLLLDQTTMKN
ncbi:hypothetical protein Tco_0764266 [Tanacetum coccineum]